MRILGITRPLIVSAFLFLFTACSSTEATNQPSGAGCAAATCEGCCDADGVCRIGLDDHICGRGAAACADCSAQEGLCEQGLCVQPGCGDGAATGSEPCDGADLGGATCVSQGYFAGTLACNADCTLDTSGCQALTCDEAAAQPAVLPCTWCSPDGGIVRCGFCRQVPGYPPIDDSFESCDAGTSCYSWIGATDGEERFACLQGPPEVCPPNYVAACEGKIAKSCTMEGILTSTDCASSGQTCQVVQYTGGTQSGAVCVEPGAQSCDPSTFVAECIDDTHVKSCNAFIGLTETFACEAGGLCGQDLFGQYGCLDPNVVLCDTATFEDRCNGNDIVRCQGTVETVMSCGVGWACAKTAGGDQCVQAGTAACDPASYVPVCDNGRIFECDPYANWERIEDCSAVGDPGVMTCHASGGSPASWSCAPVDLTPCDAASLNDGPRCEGETAYACHEGLWLEVEPCAAPNPVCVVATGYGYVKTVTCAAAGAPACADDGGGQQVYEDKYGERHNYRGLSCTNGATILGCSSALVEVNYPCPAGTHCALVTNPYYDAWCSP